MSLKFSKKYILVSKDEYDSAENKRGVTYTPLSQNPDLVLAEKTRKDIHSNLKDSSKDVYSQLEQHTHNMSKFLKELKRSRQPQRDLFNRLTNISGSVDEMRELVRERRDRVERHPVDTLPFEEDEEGEEFERYVRSKPKTRSVKPRQEIKQTEYKVGVSEYKPTLNRKHRQKFRSSPIQLDVKGERSPVVTRSTSVAKKAADRVRSDITKHQARFKQPLDRRGNERRRWLTSEMM